MPTRRPSPWRAAFGIRVALEVHEGRAAAVLGLLSDAVDLGELRAVRVGRVTAMGRKAAVVGGLAAATRREGVQRHEAVHARGAARADPGAELVAHRTALRCVRAPCFRRPLQSRATLPIVSLNF